MVNEEEIGVFQDAGEKKWWNKKLPINVIIHSSIDELKKSKAKGFLIITDKEIDDKEILRNSVVYRPPTLVVGVGLHGDTTKETIRNGLKLMFGKIQT